MSSKVTPTIRKRTPKQPRRPRKACSRTPNMGKTPPRRLFNTPPNSPCLSAGNDQVFSTVKDAVFEAMSSFFKDDTTTSHTNAAQIKAIQNTVHKGVRHLQDCEDPVTLDLENSFLSEQNQMVLREIVKYARNTLNFTDESLIRKYLRRYFHTLKRDEKRKRSDTKAKFLKIQRKRQRKITVRNRRLVSLKKASHLMFLDEERGQLMESLTNTDFISSENTTSDSSNSDDETSEMKSKSLRKSRLNWRSDFLNRSFKKLDKQSGESEMASNIFEFPHENSMHETNECIRTVKKEINFEIIQLALRQVLREEELNHLERGYRTVSCQKTPELENILVTVAKKKSIRHHIQPSTILWDECFEIAPVQAVSIRPVVRVMPLYTAPNTLTYIFQDTQQLTAIQYVYPNILQPVSPQERQHFSFNGWSHYWKETFHDLVENLDIQDAPALVGGPNFLPTNQQNFDPTTWTIPVLPLPEDVWESIFDDSDEDIDILTAS